MNKNLIFISSAVLLSVGLISSTLNNSVGFDIETGGHVLQLFFADTSAIYDAAFITETTNRWLDGNIRFRFNIS